MKPRFSDETLAQRVLRLEPMFDQGMESLLTQVGADPWDLVDLCCEAKRVRRRRSEMLCREAPIPTIWRYNSECQLLRRAARTLGKLLGIPVEAYI